MRYVDKAAIFERIGYKPHPRQKLYHASTARFRIPCCGRRFGKSTMASKDIEPELFLPKKRFWIVGPTYDLGEKEFRVLWDDLIIGQHFGADKRVKKAYNKKQGDMYIEFPWQTRIEVRSADHPENLVGEALDGVIMSEAAKHRVDTFERYVRPALGDKLGWASFPSTPEGQNWYYDLWQMGRDPDLPEYESWRFPSWDNLEVYPGGEDNPEIALIRKTSTPEWFEQEIAADFTSFVGRIYGEFDEVVHVQRVDFNPAWPNYMAFDWGFVNPLAAVEFQITPWDEIRVWREHYASYLTLGEHVRLIKERDQPSGYHLDMAFGDAADPEAAAYITQNLVACIADPEAKKNWREGVDLVKTFLKLRDTGDVDEYERPIEKPGLVIDFSCKNIAREFNNYRAPNQPTGGRNPKNPRETAQGIDDHALDALRYGLVSLYKLGAQRHLSETEEMGHYDANYGEAGMFTEMEMSF